MNSDSPAIFTASGIHFSYENEKVFSDFSLQINQGEKVAIKGESGSGKTTLFRLLLGFEYPDEGDMRYKEEPYTTQLIQQMRRELAWLPQDLNLGEGTVQELSDFLFGFEANKSQKPSSKRLGETLTKLGLEKSMLNQKYAELSTGQRQRIGLACCYLMNRDILLLDEPTSALDAQSKQKVADLLLQDGRTIISTSHDEWWLERCDRIIDLQPEQ
ncbi:ABC transporter ATP-binding protein [Gracilimonas mengyeensis]|nr:ABC transporter ATP-binding protein [Gracilimonas mengyeensis]